MRILLIGFLVFLIWAAFSTYIYVEKINVECDVPEAQQNLIDESQSLQDTLAQVATVQMAKPEDLIIHFDYKSSFFDADSNMQVKLSDFAVYLKEYDDSRLIITGYTDNIGSYEYNMVLGQKRADAVGLWIKNHGVDPEKIIITSEGEKLPLEDNTTEAGREMNRRVVITLKP